MDTQTRFKIEPSKHIIAIVVIICIVFLSHALMDDGSAVYTGGNTEATILEKHYLNSEATSRSYYSELYLFVVEVDGEHFYVDVDESEYYRFNSGDVIYLQHVKMFKYEHAKRTPNGLY